MAAVKDFEELAIFQKARELSKKIYPVTNRDGFKSDFRFVQQIRAAAGSIMDNIAEGYERNGNKEFVNFLYIAKGSCGEVRSQVVRASDVGFIDDTVAKKLYGDCLSIAKLLNALILSINKSGFTGKKYHAT